RAGDSAQRAGIRQRCRAARRARAIPPARRGDAMAAGAAALRRPRPACKLQNRGLRELVVVANPVYALDPFGPLVDAKTRSPRADGIGEAYLPLGLGLVLERARIMTPAGAYRLDQAFV